MDFLDNINWTILIEYDILLVQDQASRPFLYNHFSNQPASTRRSIQRIWTERVQDGPGRSWKGPRRVLGGSLKGPGRFLESGKGLEGSR